MQRRSPRLWLSLNAVKLNRSRADNEFPPIVPTNDIIGHRSNAASQHQPKAELVRARVPTAAWLSASFHALIINPERLVNISFLTFQACTPITCYSYSSHNHVKTCSNAHTKNRYVSRQLKEPTDFIRQRQG